MFQPPYGVLSGKTGPQANKPAVALQALLAAGEGQLYEKFVTTGAADADATFCIAALAGMIDITSDLVKNVADVVAIMDTDPIGRNLLDMGEAGRIWMGWEAITANNPKDDANSFLFGAIAWRNILSDPRRYSDVLDAAVAREKGRVEEAEKCLSNSQVFDLKGKKALFVRNSTVFGFDVWYGRNTDIDPKDAAAWAYPLVAAYVPKTKSFTVGCPNKEVAETLFGAGGLKNVFARLDGWGGREAVGGSPRGKEMTLDDFQEFLDAANAAIK